MNADWRNRYEVAVEATRQAGQLARQYFETALAIEWKQDLSPVTRADREAEQLLRTALLERFPNDGFLGEEFGDQPGSSGYRWIIDPIDGTRSFVRGIPLWATLVGLEYKGEQIAGVVECPALEDCYRALRGDGAYRNNQPIHVSSVDTLEKSHLYYSSLSWFVKAGLHNHFLELVERTERQRGFGDYFGFVLVAQGAGELMIEWGTHPWDLSALTALITEAGGKVTTWDNTPTIYQPDVIASNGLVHDQARAILRRMLEDKE
jgi:histidinol-phosphatase